MSGITVTEYSAELSAPMSVWMAIARGAGAPPELLRRIWQRHGMRSRGATDDPTWTYVVKAATPDALNERIAAILALVPR